MTSTLLTPAADSSRAQWIIDALTAFAASVTSLVPEGFPSFARVIHPAYRLDPAPQDPWARLPVSWAQIAAANGTVVHSGMQLSALTGFYRFLREGQPGVYDHPPDEGSLPEEVTRPLISVLARHTRSWDRCWFAFWNGFGGGIRSDEEQSPLFRAAPLFHVPPGRPQRSYYLVGGTIQAADESGTGFRRQTANIWWPDDCAWCVATEIDLNTTYIACSEACGEGLIAAPELEALAIDPATGINWGSDLVNPKPRHNDDPG